MIPLLLSAAINATPNYGIASHGSLKYPSTFKHFDYINPNAPKGGKLKLESIGNYDQLNPFILKGSAAEGINLIYDSLLSRAIDEPSSYYGLLAQSVDIDKATNTIEFKLRQDAYFHDGKPIAAEDAAFTFNLLIEKGSPQYALRFDAINNVTTKGPYTVIFHTKIKPTNDMVIMLGSLPILPKHFWQQHDFIKDAHIVPLGSGPYKVDKHTFGDHITYQRVVNYWGKNHPVNIGRYNFNSIQYIYFLDPSIALESFLARKLDLRQEYNSKDWATRYKTPAILNNNILLYTPKHKIPQGMQGFAFNLRKTQFQDIRVRKALELAFNYEWCNSQLFYNQYQRSTSYFNNSDLQSKALPTKEELEILKPFQEKLPSELTQTPYTLMHTDGSWYGIRPGLLKATKLLEEAGYVIKDNTLINSQTHQPFTFTLLLVSPGFKRIVLPYFENLKRLGIHAKIQLVDIAQYMQRLEEFDFEMAVASFPQSTSPGAEQIDYWHSKSATIPGSRNLMGIQNPIIDDLVERIVAASDFKQLQTLAFSLDRVLLWNYYMIPHWYLNHYRIAHAARIKHPKTNPSYGLDLDSWWSESLKN